MDCPINGRIGTVHPGPKLRRAVNRHINKTIFFWYKRFKKAQELQSSLALEYTDLRVVGHYLLSKS